MKSKRLHGNVTETSSVVLLLIDVINDLEFPDNKALVRAARPMATRIARLKQRACRAGIPAVYVNDNFGKWRSDFKKQVEHCLRDDVSGKVLSEALTPGPEDYFVLKPKHSGFFSTTLEILLQYLGARTLILTGIAGDRCVLFTAHDAFVRDYRIFIPSDCVASNTPSDNKAALKLMKRILQADIRPSAKINFGRLQSLRSLKD